MILIKESNVKDQSPNPYYERRFYIDSTTINKLLSNRRLSTLFSFAKYFSFTVLPLILLNLYIAIFATFNKYELLLLTKIYLVVGILLMLYWVINIFPRETILKALIKSFKVGKINNLMQKDSLNSRQKAFSIFFIGMLIGYVSSLPNKNHLKLIQFNPRKLFLFFEEATGVAVAVFFINHSEIGISWALMEEFTIMALLGIPDMLFSGLVTASGLSYTPEFNLSQFDKINLAIINVSLFSSIIFSAINFFKKVDAGSFYFTGNYSRLNVALSPFEFLPDGVIAVIDYGPALWPGVEPRLLHVSDIQKLALKECDLCIKNFDALNEFNKIDSWNFDYQQLMYRHFKKIELDYDLPDNGNWCLEVTMIYVYNNNVVVCFNNEAEFENYNWLIIFLESNSVVLENSSGEVFKIAFKTIFPFNFKANDIVPCSFNHDNHNNELKKSGQCLVLAGKEYLSTASVDFRINTLTQKLKIETENKEITANAAIENYTQEMIEQIIKFTSDEDLILNAEFTSTLLTKLTSLKICPSSSVSE